ncbi:MAG TPA: HAMP domain-containing sensor histidine kinase [Puia sp.]|nr:HAMP domain-containing sensor histidine kinase [Puia sp.]
MKFQQPAFSRLTGKTKSVSPATPANPGKVKSMLAFKKLGALGISGRMEMFSQKSLEFLQEIKTLGFTKTMDEYERGKLSIFNRLNFFQLITGIVVPVVCILTNNHFSATSFVIATLPAYVSFLVLCLNFYYKHEAGIIVYFILYPVVTCIVYLNGMDLGADLFFILFGILSLFFLQEISHMLFAVGFSMISYFILAVVNQKYTFQLQTANIFFYYFNEITAIVFIFYGLFLIKKENSVYQLGILASNHALQGKNNEIQKQKEEIEEKAELLRNQTTELTELNSLKNKLFSIIAHDLKSPMYALRNLFNHVQQYNLPAAEIRKMIPDVVNDLNYTTGLMENLLLWAKSQMQSTTLRKEDIDISRMIQDTIQLLHLQADAKKINILNRIDTSHDVRADKDMIALVLRNLISNAIKFTPEKGTISISLKEKNTVTEVSVQDTGVGMSPEYLEKINQNNYFSTKGTSSESGTGLGLMLCKEFLQKNGGQLYISSEPGKGSVFAFTVEKSTG